MQKKDLKSSPLLEGFALFNVISHALIYIFFFSFSWYDRIQYVSRYLYIVCGAIPEKVSFILWQFGKKSPIDICKNFNKLRRGQKSFTVLMLDGIGDKNIKSFPFSLEGWDDRDDDETFQGCLSVAKATLSHT